VSNRRAIISLIDQSINRFSVPGIVPAPQSPPPSLFVRAAEAPSPVPHPDQTLLSPPVPAPSTARPASTSSSPVATMSTAIKALKAAARSFRATSSESGSSRSSSQHSGIRDKRKKCLAFVDIALETSMQRTFVNSVHVYLPTCKGKTEACQAIVPTSSFTPDELGAIGFLRRYGPLSRLID